MPGQIMMITWVVFSPPAFSSGRMSNLPPQNRAFSPGPKPGQKKEKKEKEKQKSRPLDLQLSRHKNASNFVICSGNLHSSVRTNRETALLGRVR